MSQKRNKQYLQENKDEKNTTYQNLWNTVKAVLRGILWQ